MTKRITRADVARYAGVSTAVVSYVLNGSPKPVAEATRGRVLEAVETLGYRPNAHARALSRGRSDLLALVVPDQRNPYFAELVVEVDRAVQAAGRTLLILSSPFQRSPSGDEIAKLSAQQIDGLIAADTLTLAELTIVERARIPVVFINQFTPQRTYPSIGTDFLAGAEAAVSHLIDLGHRSIAFIGHDSLIDPRERGWQETLSAAGLPLGPVFHVDYTLQGGYEAGTRIARDRGPVTAVFAASDQIATGALAAFHAAGLDVPHDISIIGFDGTPEAAYTWPPLSSVTQAISVMATDAVELLVSGDAEPGHRRYPASLLLRGSTGRPRTDTTADD